MGSGEMRMWEDKLRKRAEAHSRDGPFARPQVADSPALAVEPKSSGGLVLPSGNDGSQKRTNVVHRPVATTAATPPASEAFRKDRVNSALATLEGGADAVEEAESMYSSSDMQAAAASRPLSFRMGRHGSSPLNPYTGTSSSPAVTGSGSIAPPLPTPPLPGKTQRKQHPLRTTQPQPGQTPLPRRWWRNIKESMYAPIPPLHRPVLPPQPAAVHGEIGNSKLSVTGIDALPARPVRRHSFSGSTDIEQQKITATLSPRENMRRKVTLVDRVRGMLRGNSKRNQQQQLQQLQQPSLVNRPASLLPMVPEEALPAVVVGSGGNWGPHNPFSQQSMMGLGRRASIDTLSVHEMAQVDNHDMQNRLDNLLSPHVSADIAPVQPHDSIAASPHLGYPASSKFSFSAGGGGSPVTTPKPLPATPRHQQQSQQQLQAPAVFTFPVTAAASSPVFKTSEDGNRPTTTALPGVSVVSPRVQEMVEKPHPVNMQHFSQDIVQTNSAQIQPQQQPQSNPPQSVADEHMGGGAPVVLKRPSLLKRITSGWRKPPGHQHQAEAVAAATAAGESAGAAGLLGQLFHQPVVAGPRPEMLTVPSVNVMHSPQAYPGAPHELSQVLSPRQQQIQQQQQYSSGSMTNPAVIVSGPSPSPTGPYVAGAGSNGMQTLLPGQQPQLQPGFPAQNYYEAFGPSIASSMPQGQVPQEQYPQGQVPHEPYPQGNVPQEPYPQGNVPQEQYPQGQVPQS
ncbi:hypothetical protein IWW38_003972, partial [Coemansia aciculifera]